MKNKPPVFFALAFLLTSCASLSFGESASYSIVARVNGKPIVSSEIRDAVQAQEQVIRMTIREPGAQQAKLAELRESAVYALIERQLILSEFEKLGGSLKAEYIEDDVNSIIRDNFAGDREKFLYELAKNGITLKKFREQREKMMIVSVLRSRQVRGLPPPTPQQVQDFYTKNADKFRDKDFIKFSTITIPKYPVGDASASPESQKKLANEIRGKVTGGSDFAALAKTYSQDSRADSGGDWGLQERAGLSPELAEVAFALKPGSVSKVTELGPSYLIIYCEAKQPGTMEPLEKVRPQIERAIQSEMGRDAVTKWLNGLAKKAVIQPEEIRTKFMEWIIKSNK